VDNAFGNNSLDNRDSFDEAFLCLLGGVAPNGGFHFLNGSLCPCLIAFVPDSSDFVLSGPL
jgi:hypothetical protein